MLRPLLCIGACLWSLPGWGGVLAEGRSSVTHDATIEAGGRMYTIYRGQEACAKSPSITQLEVDPDEIRVRVGDAWQPDQLVVRAFDAQNRFVPGAPLVVSLYEDPELVDTRGAESKVRGIKAGSLRLMVHGYCSGVPGLAEATVEIPFIVVE
ncbi:hypothetical protein [Microbulbifer aggregans]|uniref:hypothetical protein n=1 Tax=Microbulbifer aggregans TaxID=1769779 RepID=UPI001CFCD274|nr:hypothetical protein [Microbulbifer aggregans]